MPNNGMRTIQGSTSPVASPAQPQRDLFGGGYLQSIGEGVRPGSIQDPFLRPGVPQPSSVALEQMGQNLGTYTFPKSKLMSPEEYGALQRQTFQQRGYTPEQLNIPIYRTGTENPFMFGPKNNVPMLAGDILAKQDAQEWEEIQKDLQKVLGQYSGTDPITRLDMDMYGGPVDRLTGTTRSGQQVLINQQTNRGSTLGKIARTAIPAAALTGIAGLGLFGPGGASPLFGAGAATPTAATTAATTGAAAPASLWSGAVASDIAGSAIPAAAGGIGGTTAGITGGLGAGMAANSIFEPVVRNLTGGNLLGTLADVGMGAAGYALASDLAGDARDIADPFAGQRGAYQQALAGAMTQPQPTFTDPTQPALPDAPGFTPFQPPTNVEDTPGYQFRMEQGLKAMDRTASKMGERFAGKRLFDVQDYAQGLASTEYDKAWQRQFTKYQTEFSNQLAAQNQKWQQLYQEGNRNWEQEFNKYIKNLEQYNADINRLGLFSGATTSSPATAAQLFQSGNMSALSNLGGGIGSVFKPQNPYEKLLPLLLAR